MSTNFAEYAAHEIVNDLRKKSLTWDLAILVETFWEERSAHLEHCGGPNCMLNDIDHCNAIIREVNKIYEAEQRNRLSASEINKLFLENSKKEKE